MKKPKLDDQIQMIILTVLRLSLVVAAIWLGFQRNLEGFLITVIAIILATIPGRIAKRFKVVFPVEFTFVIVLFTYASTFLGEVGDAYEKFWWWDALLHISSGVILGYTGFLILYSLYIQKKLKSSPFLLSFFAFTFAVAAGAVWEMFEFAMDGLFGLNMQKNGLNDTMWDLIVDAAGGVIVAWSAYKFLKSGDKGPFSLLTENFFRHNPQIRKHPRWPF